MKFIELVVLSVLLVSVYGTTDEDGRKIYHLRTVKEYPKDWWQTAVFYQIYPRSFKDSNNDGIGDLQGIIENLDHLKDAGITGAWLSPIFKSPQVDQGYDISDYRTLDPDYGTLDDLKELLEKAHEMGIKIILDFVPNHTSDEHQWFKDSVARKPGFEDYYIWRNGSMDGQGKRVPPNNWISLFKGSAWTWNDERQQYYLHQFAPAQPDINYRNPEVVKAMKDILIYWLDFGIDGFRIDAVPFLFEDETLQDEPESHTPGYNPGDYEYLKHIYTMDLNETFDMIYQWRELVDTYSKEHDTETKVLMTEAYTTFENTIKFFGSGGKLGAHFSFNFDFIINVNINSTAQDISDIIINWMENLPEEFTFNWVIGNHDNHRVATRLGPDNVDGFNMLVSILKGVGVTYNGEEIGQENGEVTCEEGKDPSAIKNCTTFAQLSRDFERTPLHWNNGTNAGFNDGAKPWLPVSKKANETNLADQNMVGKNSHYNIYKQLMSLRKVLHNLKETSWSVAGLSDNVLQVIRNFEAAGKTDVYSLLFNVGDQVENITISQGSSYKVLIASGNSKRKTGDIIKNPIQLQPHESIIIKY